MIQERLCNIKEKTVWNVVGDVTKIDFSPYRQSGWPVAGGFLEAFPVMLEKKLGLKEGTLFYEFTGQLKQLPLWLIVSENNGEVYLIHEWRHA